MHRTNELLRPALLALALGCVAPACEQAAEKQGAQPSPPPTPAVVRAEPTDAAALERSRLYWANAQKGDWIANYDLLSPELQRQQSATMFLQGKSSHIYEDMRVLEVVARKDDQIFLRATGKWTPNHPRVRQVKLEPGQTLTQEIEIIEAWRWVKGEWKLERPMRPDEFLELHADLQPNAGVPTDGPAK